MENKDKNSENLALIEERRLCFKELLILFLLFSFKDNGLFLPNLKSKFMELIIPRKPGHRDKSYIMILNEVNDEQTIKKEIFRRV